MPRIRSVKPEFFSSEPVGNCSPTSRLLFIALWCMADDDGRLVDNPRVIRAFAFPLDDDVLSTDVDRWIEEMHVSQLIVRYQVDGRKYLCVKNFKEHQHPKKPQVSKLPAPPVPHQFPTSSPPEGNSPPTGTPRRGGEGRGVGEERRGVPPSAGDADAPRPSLVLEGEAPAPPVRSSRAVRPASTSAKWPHFPEAERQAVHKAWTEKLGAVDYPRLIAAIAPLYLPTDDPAYVPPDAILRGVRDYASMITRGRSSPFSGPEDCAKRLGALARNALENASDPVARSDRVAMILHGQVSA